MKASASATPRKQSIGRILRLVLFLCAVTALIVWMILPPTETLNYQKYDVESELELTTPFFSLSDVGQRPIVSFSADGRFAAYVSMPNQSGDGDPETTIDVIDVATGKPIAGPLGITESRTPPHIAFSGDGKRLAAAGSGEVRIWNLDDSELINTVSLPDIRLQTRRFVAINHDGSRIATSIQQPDADPAIWVFDTQSGEPLRAMERTAGTANDDRFIFHPTANRLIGSGDSDSGDTLLCVWDVETGKVDHETLSGDDCQTLAFATDTQGKRIAIAMYHGARKYAPFSTAIFDLDTWQTLIDIDNADYVFWLAFSTDGSQLALIDGSGTASMWSTSSGIRLQNFQLGLPSATAFSASDGSDEGSDGGLFWLVTNSDDKSNAAKLLKLRRSP